jgi:GT2 family glycosyltransferase
MVRFMDGNDRAGAAGCKTFWDDEKHFMFPDLRIHSLRTAFFQFTPFCRLFPNSTLSRWYWGPARRLWDATMPVRVEGIAGGFMMVRREAFGSAGAFDENFFLFFEEHDLLRRIRERGWEIYYVPGAEILHSYEESFRNSTIDTGAVFRQSAFYYYRKNYTILGYLFVRSLFLMNKFILFLEKTLRGKEKTWREVRPVHGRLTITWPPSRGAAKYLVEVSYWPAFCDRAGMYVRGESLSLSSDILDRLPDGTGFLRVTPVYDNPPVGKVKEVIRIAK